MPPVSAAVRGAGAGRPDDGEADLYAQGTAADAFRQAEGDLFEAAHLVRALAGRRPVCRAGF
jgi:alpha-D-ribose 1-methylphosphonate 5-triphosphate synthase subunit PhnI